jgi:predicted RNase H-like HicB family nuclease
MSEGLTIATEFEQESNRWIAEVVELSGVLVYGQTKEDAIDKAKVLALRVLADRLEHGETTPGLGRLFRLSSTSSSEILAS